MARAGVVRHGAEYGRAVHDGLAWLGRHFTVNSNPYRGNNDFHYYFLYGLERAGELAGVENFGPHDWYREGAEYLLAQQHKDGYWRGAGHDGPLAATSYALLFLTRGTVPASVTLTQAK